MNQLEIRNLSKKYNDIYAVNSVSFTLNNGIYGLIGPNGAGKSTLIRLLTTLEKATDGIVLYNSKEIHKMKSEYRSLIGFMPQQQVGYDNFSGLQFLYYMAALKGMKKEQAIKEIQKLVIQVNLSSSIHRKIKTYSGGMRQRLMFAQALLDNPRIIILDEPTAGLDPYERVRLRNYISEIADNRIVILATHVMQDVEAIAKEMILMRDGEIICIGSNEQLIKQLEGNVIELVVNEEQLEESQKKSKISRIVRLDNGFNVRIITKEKHINYVDANLEDVYLHFMVK